MVTSLAVAAGQRLFEGPRLVVDICTALLSWATFSLTHALLTYGVFRRLSGEILRQATSRAFPRRRLVRVLAATDGPTWAIMLGFFSLVGVTPLLLVPDLRRSGPLVTMAALVVIGSWVDVVVCYAVHYALVDRNGQMLDFPGDHPRVFSDYLYLAVATQATFGTTDVTPGDATYAPPPRPAGLLLQHGAGGDPDLAAGGLILSRAGWAAGARAAGGAWAQARAGSARCHGRPPLPT